MNIEYHKRYSPCLGRDMEFKIYGHSGRPCIYFPCQNGRFYDFENFRMLDVWRQPIEEGRIQFFTVDTIDQETWSAKDRNPHDRIVRHEQWYHYIVDELVPEVFDRNTAGRNGDRARGILTFGCSMGAMHAGNFYFRRPDIFDACLCLSGEYSSRDSFGNYMEPLIYDNSPIDFLWGMPLDHPYIQMYNERTMIFCVGQGAYEDELKASTHELDEVLRAKGIHAWVDFWGYDVNHDWDWWYKQSVYFMPYVL